MIGATAPRLRHVNDAGRARLELAIRINANTLKVRSLELGFTTVGICAPEPPPHLDAYKQWLDKGYQGEMEYLRRHLKAKSDPRALLPSVQSIIAVTLNYNQPNPAEKGQPRIARYALGRDYHKVLHRKIRALARWLQAQYPNAETRACVDSAPIMERDYAHMAGLGWFGKNTCLIDSKRGSWFFIGILLTSIPFELDSPSIGGCGSCAKCIDACPTGAIIFEDNRWQVDARNCISYLTIEHRGAINPQLAEKIGEWTFGCDICQEVCPFNEPRPSQPVRAATTTEADFSPRRRWPNLKQLTQITQTEWDSLTRGSGVRRAGYAGIQRNAEINLQSAQEKPMAGAYLGR